MKESLFQTYVIRPRWTCAGEAEKSSATVHSETGMDIEEKKKTWFLMFGFDVACLCTTLIPTYFAESVATYARDIQE